MSSRLNVMGRRGGWGSDKMKPSTRKLKLLHNTMKPFVIWYYYTHVYITCRPDLWRSLNVKLNALTNSYPLLGTIREVVFCVFKSCSPPKLWYSWGHLQTVLECKPLLIEVEKNLHEKRLASLKSRQNPVQDSRLSKSNIFVRLRQAVLGRVDLNTCKLYPSKIGLTGNIFRSSETKLCAVSHLLLLIKNVLQGIMNIQLSCF